jgi:superfamily I DNA and/or RNA helicase
MQVGFLEDWRRANVALSRARTALVVVGHKGTLRTSKTWGAFLQHAQDRGCLVQLQHLKHIVSSAKKR